MPFPTEGNQNDVAGKFYWDAEKNTWQCANCDYTNDNWIGVNGHQTKHSIRKEKKPVGRVGNVKGKDPMKMTIQETVDTITELRSRLAEAEASAKEATARLEKLKEVFSSVEESLG